MPSEGQPKDEKINDYKQAEVGAYGEKRLRDLSRIKGIPITKEEKEILDNVAERHGEKAMQEYALEKEKNPVERFLSRIDKIATEMKEKGLVEDAKIVEKIKGRFSRFAKILKDNKAKLEEDMGREVSLDHLENSSYKVFNHIAVVHKINESGGTVYNSEGFSGTWFGEKEALEKNKDLFDNLVKKGGEIINYSFTKEGEEEFYRLLGVLGEKEGLKDILVNFKKDRGYDVNPQNYKVEFPTNIDGIMLYIKKEKKFASDFNGIKSEESISLGLNDNFMKTILERE